MCLSLGIDFKLRSGRGFKTDVDKLVKLVREKFRLGNHQRLAANLLAKELGMVIREPQDISSMSPHVLEQLTVHGKDRWSALLLKDPLSARQLIINNPTHSECRKESNIFHEISHHFCGHEPDEIEMIGGWPVRRFSKEKEDQAEALAFSLHLPRDCLFWAAYKGLSREDIGSHFCASRQVVAMRINGTSVERILKKKIP